MIEINKQNYTEHLNKKEGVIYSLHDDLLSVFNIDFFSKTAAITVRKSYPQRKDIKIIIQDIISINCTNGCFWGKDYAIYAMDIDSDPEKICLYLTQPDSLEKCPEEYYAFDEYIHIWIGLMSGDVINMICKTIFLEDIPLE
ncbi:MAG: hypothetical protein IJL25_04740 [Clostridia bacterium]|nr:hypothetical protein [Clostridia bacterium]MBR5424579.1 hypothetical protein [Clostridia bacterium]